MKLLHTSDLHLGQRWKSHPRRQDQDRVLDEILGLCDQHNVDLLLITGDILADRVEGEKHAAIARQFLKRLSPHLEQGRAVFLLRGNHDPLELFQLMRLLVEELAGNDRWPLVVADLPDIYKVPGRALQVVALPYITPSWLEKNASEPGLSPEERMPALAGQLALFLKSLSAKIAQGVPAIFAGHVLVGGTHLNDTVGSEVGYHQDIWVDPANLPSFTSYNALGHIHRSQQVQGVGKPTWYAGSPDRHDLGERAYQPQVLLVTTPDTPGGVALVEPILLSTCTPFVYEQLVGIEGVSRFCTSLATSGAADPLGEITLADIPAGTRTGVLTQLSRVAPRLQVIWAQEEVQAVPSAAAYFDPHDISGVFLSYVERAYAHDPEKQGRLKMAFQSLWSELREGLA